MDRDLHPLCQDFIQAGQELQFPHNPDFNGARQEGFGTYQNTAKDGMRMSAARAYLRPATKRQNLNLQKNALVTRILFEKKRATGVAYKQNGQDKVAHARREVILSAGAVNSPQILQLSGVGPADHLRKLGIDVVHAVEAVGKHLQDHLAIDFLFQLPTCESHAYRGFFLYACLLKTGA